MTSRYTPLMDSEQQENRSFSAKYDLWGRFQAKKKKLKFLKTLEPYIHDLTKFFSVHSEKKSTKITH